MTARLSILCPGLFVRQGQWPILENVRQQCLGTAAELIVLLDDGRISVGEKHNALFRAASGDYLCTVADDDEVTSDYVATLLDAIGSTDAVTYVVDWKGAFGWAPSSCDFRPLAPVRRAIAQRFTFPDWWQSEDRAYREWMYSQRPTVKHVDKILYRYNHRPAKPEYGGLAYPPLGRMATDDAVNAHVRAQQ